MGGLQLVYNAAYQGNATGPTTNLTVLNIHMLHTYHTYIHTYIHKLTSVSSVIGIKINACIEDLHYWHAFCEANGLVKLDDLVAKRVIKN